MGKNLPRSITSKLPCAATRKWCWLRSAASHPTATSSARMMSQRTRRCSVLPLRDATCSAMAEHTDEGDVAVLVRCVQTVTDHEAVLDLETEIVDGDPGPRPGGLVQERAELHRGGAAGGEVVEQVAHGQAGVDDVLDDQYVLALDGSGHVARDLHHAGGLRRFPITGEPDEVDADRQIDRAAEIRHEDVGAFQHAQKDQLL